MLDSMSSWVTLTPATLFLFLNLVIGTIAVASRFGSHHRPPPHHHPQGNDHDHQYQPLERRPSLLERVRSGNFPLYRYPPADSEHEYPAQTLQGPPSLLERVKSIDFSSYYRSEPQTGFTHDHDPSISPLITDPRISHDHTGRVTEYNTASHGAPSVLERVKSIGFSTFYASHHLETSADEPGYENDRVDPPKLERGPSLLQRVKSIKFPSLYRYGGEAESGSDLFDEYGSGMEHPQVTRSKTEPRKKQAANPKMKKSASVRVAAAAEEEEVETVERRRPTTTKVEKTHMFGDEEVDAKADDFINRFKQQLKLQRLDSLLRYKEIITGK